MDKRPEFQQHQYRFTAHIRDPENNPLPEGVEDRRMAIYRDLLFNNINSFLEGGFPVLRSLYDDAGWQQLARSFFTHHQSKTPYFLEIPQEFLAFIETEYQPAADDPPFLQELAHYEWVELALMVAEETQDSDEINPHGSLLDETPVVSTLAWSLAYTWPVHKISAENQLTEPPPQPTYLIVHRNDDDEVKFIEVNPVTARLIQLLEEPANASGRQRLEQIAYELGHSDPEMVIQGGHQTLLKLHKAGVIRGTRKTR
jgi:hypothetical protein